MYQKSRSLRGEKNVLGKCVMSMACILHHSLKTTEVSMKRKVPDPLLRSAQGTIASAFQAKAKPC